MVDGAPAGDQPLSLAVVGDGPKALFALEELCAQLSDAARHDSLRALEITVVAPGPVEGTGAAYDVTQPHSLRLNVDAALLDVPATGTSPSFRDWVAAARPTLVSATYPPRAVVGEYLHARWRRVLADMARTGVTARTVSDRAVSLRRTAGGWEIVTASHGALPPVEEILLATGHAAEHSGALARTWSSTIPLRPAVLPAAEMLDSHDVPPGARVALRGSALTFIDAALVLTLERGGRFTPRADGVPGLLHRRGSEEPLVLLPTARHGRLLDAKPDPRLPLPAGVSRAVAEGARRLGSTERTDVGPDAVIDLVLGVATAALAATGTDPHLGREAVEGALASGSDPDLHRGPGHAEDALRRSVEIGRGGRAPGPAWILGRVWAGLYRPLTLAVRGSAAPAEEWARFRRASQVLERFAFGPPLEVAEMLLAMIGSGALDLSWVDAGTRITASGIEGAPPGHAPPDVVVDAVLAPPGIVGILDPLSRALVDQGLVEVRPARRGAAVDHDGTALAGDRPGGRSQRQEGLALLGRPTEDHVIGHDTLNRHLHDEPRLWAARITSRLRRTDAGPSAPPRPTTTTTPERRIGSR